MGRDLEVRESWTYETKVIVEGPWGHAKNVVKSASQSGCSAAASRPADRREEIALSSKRYANRSWGSNGVGPLPTKRAATFDQIVENMGLSTEQFEASAELKEWVRVNMGRKYVPIDLLIAWGFDVEPQ
jgi:hypothetical protein